MKGSPVKLLAKLNAKTGRFERSSSGTDGITSLDVAHVCGLSLSEVQSMLLRVKWAGDASLVMPLIDALTEVQTLHARRKKWAVRKPDIIKRMVILALREREIIRPRRVLTTVDSPFESGAEKCRGCKGVGRRFSRRQDKIITCERCEGSGERRWTDAERANHCGIHRQNWPDKWERRYLGLVEWLRATESCAVGAIRPYMADTHEEFLELKRDD